MGGMPLDVYLLVGHHQRPSDRSDIQVYLKLPAQGSELMVRLSKAYRQMPDPLRLVVLFSRVASMQPRKSPPYSEISGQDLC